MSDNNTNPYDGLLGSYSTEGIWDQGDGFRIPVRYTITAAWYTPHAAVANIGYTWFDPRTGAPCAGTMISQVLTGVQVNDSADALKSARMKVWLTMEDVWSDLPMSTGEIAVIQRMSQTPSRREGDFTFESDHAESEVRMHWEADWESYDGCFIEASFEFQAMIGSPGDSNRYFSVVRTLWADEITELGYFEAQDFIEKNAVHMLNDSIPSPADFATTDPVSFAEDHPGVVR